MSKPVIEIQGIGKCYHISATKERYLSLRDEVAKRFSLRAMRFRAREEEFWALKDVTLSVEAGECVGIIGRNGAGKSTLLKILSQITPPTEGKIFVRGRVGSLLEVGTGFHPELTGRENIYMNGAILGMRRREIAHKFDEIVAFAEIDAFLDTPVKRYSSGMYVRLAFAVAAHLDPEILVVDEVLAVGDTAFQRKCLGKMQNVARGGRTILFVSHQMAAIENLCGTGILLDAGRCVRQGPVKEVVKDYLLTFTETSALSVSLANLRNRSGNGIVRLTGFHVEDGSGKRLVAAQSGMSIALVFSYECTAGISQALVDVETSIGSLRMPSLWVFSTAHVGQTFRHIPLKGQFRCSIPRLPLGSDCYRIGGRVLVNGVEADWPHDGAGYMQVEGGDYYGTGKGGGHENGPLLLDGGWHVSAGDTSAGL